MGYTEFNDDLPARIKEQADIVQIIGECVELKQAGVRFLGRCPFHNEKTPSFSVHPGQQFYYCFGCGASGDVLEFQMKYHNLDFPTALKELARRYNIEIPERTQSPAEKEKSRRRKAMYAVNEKAASIFRKTLISSSHAKNARQYLENRKIPVKMQERFGLGYVPSTDSAGWNFLGAQLNKDEAQAAIDAGLLVKKEKGGTYDRFRDRILFPIYDRQGRVIGFGGRIIGDGQPKYMNSPESLVFNKSASLLGLYQQGDDIRRRKQAILVEGNFDLVSLVVHGCLNVVAPLGTALTTLQLKLLKGFADECILLFDGDTAGVKAAMRSVPLFLSEQMAGKVALLPTGHDPDTFVRENGLEALTVLLEKAKPLPEFALAQLVEEHGLTLDGKRKIIDGLQPLLSAAGSKLQRSLMVSHFSEILGVSGEELRASITLKKQLPVDITLIEERSNKIPVVLSIEQKQLIEHMVFDPKSVFNMEEAGFRDSLKGTIGEVLLSHLYLQQKEENTPIEPEDWWAELDKKLSEERDFVFSILGSSTGREDLTQDEIIVYLKCKKIENKIQELQRKLNDKSEAMSEDDKLKIGSEIVKQNKLKEEQQKKYASFLC